MGKKTLRWEDTHRAPIERIGLEIDHVAWFSTYRVHHRVADTFRRGSVFLLGDAGHVHSPVGGQGMSTGLGDALNLAWKLASVLGQRANGDLLDTYEPERIAFARRLVATTDRVFKAASSDGPFAEWARTRTSYDPTAIWVASSAGRMQRTAWRSISCRTECAAAERAHDGSNTLATPSPFMRASPQMTAWRTAGLAR